MCGRFLLDREISEIIKKYKIKNNKVTEYNVGDFYPSKKAPIILDEESKTITLAKWGFSNSNNKKVVINARSETITEKPMFKNAILGSRCVIPANLFYEWKDEGNRKKTKYKIRFYDNDLILLGGIYRISYDTNQREQMSFVIITTEAEGDIKAIHHRMPLIINNDELDLWINKNTSTRLVKQILKSNTGNKLKIEKCEAGITRKDKFEQLKMKIQY